MLTKCKILASTLQQYPTNRNPQRFKPMDLSVFLTYAVLITPASVFIAEAEFPEYAVSFMLFTVSIRLCCRFQRFDL